MKDIDNGVVRNVEFTFKGKDGQEFPGELSSNPLHSSAGDITGFVSTIRNITERKKVEKENRSLAKFPFENPNPVLRIAKDGNVLFANPASKSLLNGLKIEVGQPLPPRVRHLVADALNSGLRKETEFVLENRTILAILAPVTDAAYVNLYGTDITKRKKTKEALIAERDRLETVTKNIGAGLAIISKDYRTLWANSVLKQIFGDVEGKKCYSTYNQSKRICQKCGVREIFNKRKDRVVHEEVGKAVNGKIVWSEITATQLETKKER